MVENPALGDLWIVQYEGKASDGPPPGTSPYGHGYVFSLKGDGSGDYEWVDAGRLQGPPGQGISLQEDVTVNSNSSITSSTGEFTETSTDGEYALTLNIAPSDVTVGNLSELIDVCDTTPTDKQVLAWDKTNSVWCPANPTAAAALPISDTRDPTTVTLDSPSENVFEVTADSGSKFSGQIQCDTYTTKDGANDHAKIVFDDGVAAITTPTDGSSLFQCWHSSKKRRHWFQYLRCCWRFWSLFLEPLT